MEYTASFLIVFDQAPEHGKLIGKLVAGYSDLEVALMGCVNAVRNNLDTAFKAMYRCRGEKQRVDVADALARHHFDALGLGRLTPLFAEGIGAIDHCRRIRNQYAHCQWWNGVDGYIHFVNLEDLAATNAKVKSFEKCERKRVNLPLLEDQLSFFKYVISLLAFVEGEVWVHLGRDEENFYRRPQQQPRPSLTNDD